MIALWPRSLLWKLGIALIVAQVMIAVASGWYLEHSMKDVDNAVVAQARWTIVVAAMAANCITIAVVWMVARRSATMVTNVTDAAKHYSSGHFTHRLNIPPGSALAPLSAALTDMARQLDQRIDELETRQTEQQAILQSMSNSVIAMDGDQRIINVNDAAMRMLGIDVRAARGRLLQEVVRQPALNAFVGEAMKAELLTPAELTLAGDTSLIVRVTAEPLNDSDGRWRGLLLVMEDITELRRLESMRSDFAANVSHELRTPITNIKGYVETLLEVGCADSDQTRRFLDIIRTNSSRLSAIIEDMMALTRLEQHDAREALGCHPVPVDKLIISAVSPFAQQAAEKGITLTTEAPDQLAVNVRSQLMEQAIGNLVSNAISYSDAGGRVRVRAEQRVSSEESGGGEVVIAVEDHGPGIAAEHLPRLFERLYRVDKARSREIGGTGLGLAIVKHIALLHGGRAEVESTVGRGSTFRIVLPA